MRVSDLLDPPPPPALGLSSTHGGPHQQPRRASTRSPLAPLRRSLAARVGSQRPLSGASLPPSVVACPDGGLSRVEGPGAASTPNLDPRASEQHNTLRVPSKRVARPQLAHRFILGRA